MISYRHEELLEDDYMCGWEDYVLFYRELGSLMMNDPRAKECEFLYSYSSKDNFGTYWLYLSTIKDENLRLSGWIGARDYYHVSIPS